MQIGLLQNLKINAPQADQSALLEKSSGEINGGFAGLMNLESLLQNPEALSFEEQSKLLKEIVVDLPKESLQDLTALVKENFGEVLDTFPKLKQSLDKGDVKAFVNALTQMADGKDLQDLQKLQEIKSVDGQQVKLPIITEENSEKTEKTTESRTFFPSKLNLNKETIEEDNPEIKKSVLASDDFLDMKKMMGKKQSMHTTQKSVPQELKGEAATNFEKAQAPQVNQTNTEDQIALMKQMRPNKQMAMYSKQSDQFTDQFIKPTSFKNNETVTVANNGETVQSSNMELAALSLGQNQGQDSQSESQMQNNDSGVALKTGQVLNLSSLSAKSPAQLISKISDYIQQNAIMNENNVEMVVTHDDLGQFKVHAQKTGRGNQMEIAIETVTKDGHKFFAENEVQLIKSLNDNGIKLSGIKISQITDGKISTFTDNSRNLSDNNSQQGNSSSHGQQQNFGRNQHQQSGQERRRDLWNMYREQANYSAA